MKVAYAGAGLALTMGVLLGAAMRPDLSADGRPAGPQIVADGAGRRATERFDDGLGVASYNGKVPDYVLGTDWKKPADPARAAASRTLRDPAPAEAVRDDPTAWQADTDALVPTAYGRPPPARLSYPWLEGGAADDDIGRGEPRPLAGGYDVDADAAP